MTVKSPEHFVTLGKFGRLVLASRGYCELGMFGHAVDCLKKARPLVPNADNPAIADIDKKIFQFEEEIAKAGCKQVRFDLIGYLMDHKEQINL
jgi:hypothetical protein